MFNNPTDQSQGPTPGPTQPLPTDFVETATPEISVPELLARVQEEVARRRKAAALQNSSDSSPVAYLGTGLRSRSSLDWGLITSKLHIAEKNACVGNHVPKMKRFPGPFRVVARLLAAGLLYPLKIITNPQREFNLAALGALIALWDGVRQLEKTNQQSLADLEKRHLNEIKTALTDQERIVHLNPDEGRRKAA
jgi:hypothetical protein